MAAQALLRRVINSRVRVSEFNPISLLVRREMDLSRLLGWLLDPMGNHRLGAAPLDRFLALVGVDGVKGTDRCRVGLEVPRRVGRKLAGRIDIELSHYQFEVLIENKPFAAFGDRQLERYVETLPADGRQGRVVALLGAGWSNDVVESLKQRSGAMALRLGFEVRDWVVACADAAPPDRIRDLLITFGEDLDERHGGMGAAVTARIVDDVMATPDDVAAAISIIQARDAIGERMTRDFTARVARRLDGSMIGALRAQKGDRPLFCSNKEGVLRIDIGLEGFDVELKADGTNFTSAYIGVTARRRMPQIAKLHADRITSLAAALGSSSDTDLHALYLWWRWLDEFGSAGATHEDGPAMWAWAADDADDGLAAVFVGKAAEIKAALGL